MNKGRVESFSDGVFAFAITLLVLNITVPAAKEMDAYELWKQLGSHWADYLAYVLSFLTITVMWLNHHALLVTIKEIDRHFILYNNFLLLNVVLVPFSTAVLSKFPTLTPAAFVYGVVLSLQAAAFNLMWFHALRGNGLIHVDSKQVKSNSMRYLLGLTIYLCATALAFLMPALSIFAFVAVLMFFVVPGGIEAEVGKPHYSASNH